MSDDPFLSWFDALEQRHLASLSFSEVRRAVQALSSLYVERRARLGTGSALDGAGKRAAFAFVFGPLHFLLVREIVRALDARIPKGVSIFDIGCGTGVAGAAWALEIDPHPKVIGVEKHQWALQECKWTYRELGIRGVTRSADLTALKIPSESAVTAAFTINELDPATRDRFHDEFLKPPRRAPVLIIEPIARRLTSWWNAWAEDFLAAGGREDTWRFRVELPERLALMDRAAGLDHRELTGRSLWLNP